MSIYDMEMAISKLEKQNKELRQQLQEVYPFYSVHLNQSGLERAKEDEAVEETYFRLITESPTFEWILENDDPELFMLGLMQECLSWIANRKIS